MDPLDAKILEVIRDHAPIGTMKMAPILDVSPGCVTKHVRWLRQFGFIERVKEALYNCNWYKLTDMGETELEMELLNNDGNIRDD